MDLGLREKRALITGGSKGIGRETALTLAREGARVCLVARGRDGLEAARALIREQVPDAEVAVVEADLEHEAEAQKAAAVAWQALGGIDILINCAGAAPGGLLLELDDHTWERALGLKFLGYVRMTKAVVPYFLRQGGGVIINVVGNDGVKPSYWELTGTAANAADLAVMQALADQYGRDNIRIASVNPGPVDTGRWEGLTAAFARDKGISRERADQVARASMGFGRIARPDEVASVVAFLASARASFVHGTMINIDANQRKAIMDVDS
jgi:NAD(P)-dependent dehydrogenase (short-subunit alcohol dehydrogenase family)